MSIIRTLRTIRYLKSAQITGQIRHRLRPYREHPDQFFQMPAPEPGECRWDRYSTFLAPGAQGNAAADVEAGRFTFVNREEDLGWPPVDWNVSGLPKLWQYNLHYFEWLWALGYPAARAVMLDWIARHPLDKGKVGWEPYPTSLRLMNWCGVCFGKFRGRIREDHEFTRPFWRSVYLQTEWLSQHIETHLLGNHLFENGAALAFVGSCFGEKNWLDKGLEILAEQIPEQILPDGMHFERSPMYHARMTYLLGMLLSTKNEALKELVEAPLLRMRQALAHLCHSDGNIALFNDSAFSVYNHPGELLGTASNLAPGPWSLPDAGYYGWRGADGSYLICDAGPIGPDYIPGHAHGDLFSFELSLRGQRVIVDSGVYDYVPGEMRRYCRSTRAHNTVEIDGEDQCEFWGAFRVARRGHPRDVQWEPASDGFRLSGWHDGYTRLVGAPAHHRTVVWNSSNRLEVHDRIKAKSPVTAVSRLHLHPNCRIRCLEARHALIEYSEGSFLISFTGEGEFHQEDTVYCREFGRKEPNMALVFTFKGKDVETGFTLVSA